MLAESGLSRIYWGEALLTATYLYNRTPHLDLQFKTPYQMRYSILPDLSNLRKFGSKAYKVEDKPKKLEPKAIQ